MEAAGKAIHIRSINNTHVGTFHKELRKYAPKMANKEISGAAKENKAVFRPAKERPKIFVPPAAFLEELFNSSIFIFVALISF